jgi:hypothetical protein
MHEVKHIWYSYFPEQCQGASSYMQDHLTLGHMQCYGYQIKDNKMGGTHNMQDTVWET